MWHWWDWELWFCTGGTVCHSCAEDTRSCDCALENGRGTGRHGGNWGRHWELLGSTGIWGQHWDLGEYWELAGTGSYDSNWEHWGEPCGLWEMGTGKHWDL